MKPLPSCIDCGNKLKRHHNKRCRSCFGKFISTRLSGEKHYRYKDGRKKPCLTCGEIIKAPYPRNCRSCYLKLRKKFNPEKGISVTKNTGKTHFKKGMTPWNKGNHTYCIGSKNPSWRGGITPLIMAIRSIAKYGIWRMQIFKRDGFRCTECFKKASGKLEAHHTKSFKKIFDEFLINYNQFSPIEDKDTLVRLSLNYNDFWDINNGTTLCEDCHNLTKGVKKNG